MSGGKSFEELGGRVILEKMAKIFYDKVYLDPWLGQFFAGVEQRIIEEQQVDFLQSSLGGKKVYCGKLPVAAHKHMFITPELYELRSKLFLESMEEVNACQELIDKLCKIDAAFYDGLVKNSPSECEKRYNTDEFIIIAKPNERKVA